MSSKENQNAHAAEEVVRINFLKSLASSLSVWALFLFTGGVIFAVYYARIHYLPDIELNAALSYLAAASVIGGGLVLLLTMLLVIPGFIWANYFTRDGDLEADFCDKKEIVPVKFLVGLVLPFFLFSVTEHLILITQSSHAVWLWVFLFAAIAGTKIWWIWHYETKECANETKLTRLQILFTYLWRYTSSVASGLIAIYVLFKLLGLSHVDEGKALGHLIVCTFGVVLANAAVARFFHNEHLIGAVASAMVFALVLLAATDAIDHVPDKILWHYGFGQQVRLIVNEDGEKVLRASGIKTEDTAVGLKLVPDAKILCRMGPNYFLEFKSESSNVVTRLTVPKSDIISLIIEQQPVDRTR